MRRNKAPTVAVGFAVILDVLPDPVLVISSDRVTYANAAAKQAFAAARDEDLLGKSPFEFVAPESRALVEERIERVLQGGPTQVIDVKVVRLDGQHREVQAHGSMLKTERGKAIQVVLRDVTEQRASERALREAHASVQRHLKNTPLGVIEWDGELRISRFEGRAEEIFGWRADEVLGKRADEIPWIPRSDWPTVAAAVEQMVKGTRPLTVVVNRNIRKDGEVIYCRWFNSSLYDGDGRLASVLSLVQDDTEREIAAAALKRSEARFRTLAENVPIGVIETDLDGNATFANEAFARISGLSVEECLGPKATSLVQREDRDIIRKAMAEAMAKGSGPAIELRYPRPDGTTRLVRSWGVALHGADGKPTGFLAVSNDITELRSLREQLAVSARLAAMGTLVAGVAHEINNPLAGTMSSLGLAIEDLREVRGRLVHAEAIDREDMQRVLDDALDCLGDADTGVRRIEHVVKDLVTFGRPDSRRARVRLADVVEAAMRWGPGSTDGSASIEFLNEPTPDVMASRGQLLQVVVNLVTNAAKSIPPGRVGHIRIRTGRGAEGSAFLEVEDNGSGIPTAVAGKIFDPFFTTRPVGKGMGLGLPICHAIVTGHGGTITFTSDPGKGSTFRVELPAAAPDA